MCMRELYGREIYTLHFINVSTRAPNFSVLRTSILKL